MSRARSLATWPPTLKSSPPAPRPARGFRPSGPIWRRWRSPPRSSRLPRSFPPRTSEMSSETNYTETKHWLRTARTISEALPYMRRYNGKNFVIKYGGHAMVDKELADVFARDIVLLKQVGINPIVVHGGGPQINDMLKRLNIKSEFIDGLRVTDSATMEVVGMMLARKQLMHKDGKTIDLGFVGDPEMVNAQALKTLAAGGLVPVIAPIGYGEDGQTYNINADTAAGAIAAAVGASRLLL